MKWWGIVVAIFFFGAQPVLAVSISLSNIPSSISSDIFNIDVSISGATNATNYLRVDLYKDGTIKYFGETYNGSDWYGGSDGKSYFPVLIQNSSASATLQAQIGNPSIDDYPGPGTYKLKIRRYTSSGSQSSNDSQTPVDVQITYSAPTPTPTLTPASTPTPTPILTPTPTPTPKPTPTPTPKPLPTPTPISTFITLPTPARSATPSVAGGSPSPSVLGTSSKEGINWLAIIMVVLGAIAFGTSVFLIFRQSRTGPWPGKGES